MGLVLSGCGGHPTERRAIAAVTVAGGDSAFEPATITVEKDDNVVLAVGNSTTGPHGISIEGYGIQREIAPGGMELKFKATHPGTFRIYCQLHADTHKVATLVVQ